MSAIPTGVVEIRAEICARCPTPCEQQRDAKAHRDPCAACPIVPTGWGNYDQCEQFGLGDAVASVAQPIARGLDRVLGTNLANCGGCKSRQAALNRLLPNLGKSPKPPDTPTA